MKKNKPEDKAGKPKPPMLGSKGEKPTKSSA